MDAISAKRGLCAYGQAVTRVFKEYRANQEILAEKLVDASRWLLDMNKQDVLTLGVPRLSNHLKNSRWLYYDGWIEVTLSEYTKGVRIPAHDHGNAEGLIVYSGRVHHTLYGRKDDGSKDGYADLEVLDDRHYGPGSIALVVPPTDIHSFVGLEEGTWVIAVTDGPYMPVRHYYQPDKKTVTIQGTRTQHAFVSTES